MKKKITVSGVCESYMLRVYAFDFRSIPLLSVYLRMHLTTNPRSMAGVPSGRALPCYCAPLVCVPDVIGVQAVWRRNKPKPKNLDIVYIKEGSRP